MSRQYDAKQEALKAYPRDREAGLDLFLDFLGVREGDFAYSEGMTCAEYIYCPDPDIQLEDQIERKRLIEEDGE